MVGQQEQGTRLYLVDEGGKGTWECRDLPLWATFKEGTFGKDAQRVLMWAQCKEKDLGSPPRRNNAFFWEQRMLLQARYGQKILAKKEVGKVLFHILYTDTHLPTPTPCKTERPGGAGRATSRKQDWVKSSQEKCCHLGAEKTSTSLLTLLSSGWQQIIPQEILRFPSW